MKKVVAYFLSAICAIGLLAEAAPLNAVQASGRTAYVALHQITVHTSDDNDSKEEYIPYRTKVTKYTNEEDGWIKLKVNGKIRWHYSHEGENSLVYSMPKPNFKGQNKYQTRVLKVAKKVYTKWKTAYGHNASEGKKAKNGKRYFDCSGFVSYCLNTGMHKYSKKYQLSKNIKTIYNTKKVGKWKVKKILSNKLKESKLKPGDVLFFKLNGGKDKYDHCAIYLGNGEMIHSTHNFGGKVRLMPLTGIYEDGFVAAKRYIPAK
ncbi:MAG: NlpC/P60 family protein [Lachnospiraceae bacterium]|nr:NlpC/P60 family protein [Lachnospiraceae bacterium]